MSDIFTKIFLVLVPLFILVVLRFGDRLKPLEGIKLFLMTPPPPEREGSRGVLIPPLEGVPMVYTVTLVIYLRCCTLGYPVK